MMRNFFIVIEGIDGSGKSSITRRLVKVLEATLGQHVKLTFEPHDPSCAGLFIRQVLMKKISNIPARTLALAFAANRADHCDREIAPFLGQPNGEHRVVICDRYYLSSLVYQSTTAFGFEEIMSINSAAIRPDLTIFLTASSRTCYERMRVRGDEKELFEVNLDQTRKRYLDAIDFLRAWGDNVVTVEAEGTISEVFNKVVSVIAENSPEWLMVQDQLLMDEFDSVYNPTLISADAFTQSIMGSMPRFGCCDDRNEDVGTISEYVKQKVDQLSFDDAATLFLDCLETNGYTVHDKLPWTDLDAFELSYTLPLGVIQRGTALLLGTTQRYDAVIAKLLGSQKVNAVGQMSDFLFIFDSNPTHLRTNYYEREKIIMASSQRLSPMLVVFGRSEIADIITGKLENHIREHQT